MRLRPPLPRPRGGTMALHHAANPGARLLSIWPLLITFLFIVYLGITRKLPSDEGGSGPGGLHRHSRELKQSGDCLCSLHQLQRMSAAPLLCRLGMPSHRSTEEGSGSGPSSGDTGSSNSSRSREGAAAAGNVTQAHKLAVLIPYRDRETHLSTLLSRLHPFLKAQGVDFDSFVIEQGDDYLFNRGALLNAGALLLEGSSYEYYVFHDVDTIPKEEGGIRYSYPQGAAPLHLTPFGVHPKANYEDFFGGLVIFTAEQFRRVNGFGTQYWGWGREDDNMRERLVRAGMWPPELPQGPELQQQQQGQQQQQQQDAPKRLAAAVRAAGKRRYFEHQPHKQASELRGKEVNGSMVFFEENPRKPYDGAKIMSSQPNLLLDMATGLNTTQFRVSAVRPFAEAVKYTVELYCDTSATPWCLPSAITQRPGAKRRHQVHAVASGIT